MCVTHETNYEYFRAIRTETPQTKFTFDQHTTAKVHAYQTLDKNSNNFNVHLDSVELNFMIR